MAKSNTPLLDFRPTVHRSPWLGSILIGMFFLVLYGWLKAPDIVCEGDSGEIVTALHGFGIIHSPGFPGYVVAAELFRLVTPWLSSAQAGNLFSALASAVEVALLFAMSWKIGLRWTALLPSLAMGIGLEFWYTSLMTEVYALSLLMILINILVLAFADFEKTRSHLLFGFVLGYGISVHVYIWALVPLFLFIWWRRQASGQRRLGLLVCGLGLGLISYIYIPFRANEFFYVNEGGINSLSRFFDHVTWILQRERINPGSVQNLAQWTGVKADQAVYLIGECLRQWSWLTIIILGFAIWGRAALKKGLSRTQSPIEVLKFIATLGAIYIPAVELFIFAGREFRLADMGEMAVHLLPFYLMLLILFACGLAQFQANSVRSKYLGVILGLLFIARLIYLIPQMNLSENHMAVDHGRDLLEFLPNQAILIGDNDNDLMPTIYLTGAMHFRTDIVILNMSNGTKWYFDNLRQLYPDLRWSFYSPLYLLSLIKTELDGGRSVFFSNNFAAITFLEAAPYRNDVAIVPRLGAFQLLPKNQISTLDIKSDPTFHFEPVSHKFALRGTEIDLYGGRADYHLQRSILFQKLGDKAAMALECSKGDLYATVYESPFNNEIRNQLRKSCSLPL